MTIGIEAGASQIQCSMKKLAPTIIFRRCFLDQFVLNDTSTRAAIRASPLRMRVLGGQLILKPIRRSTSLAYQRRSIWNCSTTALL